MRRVMSHLQDEGTYFLAGTNSIYVPSGKRRYLDKSVCKPWPDLDGQTRLMPPGEAARTELLREWPHLKKVGWRPGQQVLFDWRSPMAYTGPYAGYMIYVDLDAAYSQIYSKLWLDTSYPRGYYGRYPLAAVAERLKVWKVARNSLVGLVRSREGVAYRGTKRIRIKMQNRFLSPGLWATTQNILHWIAAKALDCGAIYLNVDGYIFPGVEWEFVEEFTTWLSGHGIKWSVRGEGLGEIVSWNNYQIGPLRTQAHRLGLTHNSKEFNNANITDRQLWARYWGNVRRIRSNGNTDEC